MRVLHLTSHLNVGGITRYVVSLSKYLVRRGHAVTVVSGGGAWERELAAVGATHWRLPLHTKADISLQVLWAARQLLHRLRREPVDLVHAHTRVGQVAAALVARQLGTPYVTTWHGVYRRRLGRRLWPCVGARTIAISRLVERHLLEDFHLSPGHVRLIENGVDVEYFAQAPSPSALQAFRERWGLPDHRPVIGSLGRLASGGVKGFDLLLGAAAHLRERVPNLEILVVGDGPRREFLEDETRRLSLDGRVHFVGVMDDVRIALAVMDVFVFASRWPEGFGLTLAEAMAAGRPVVAARAGAVDELIEHGRSGWLVPPDDAAALAEGVAHLLADRQTAAALGQAGQERVRSRYSLERVTDEVEAVYHEVARAARRP